MCLMFNLCALCKKFKKMLKFNDIVYKYTRKGFIQIEHNKKVPETFFKYYGLNEYSVDALTNLYIYVSDPVELNDSLDCSKELIDFDDESAMETLDTELYAELVKQIPEKKFRQEVFKDAYQSLIYKKCGIFSMTTTPYNTKMWSAYTGNKGFCVEFVVDNFPFKCYGPFPINYCEHLQTMKVSEYDVPTLMAYQSNVKKECWKDENEWRLIVPSPDGFNFLSMGEEGTMYNLPSDIERKMKYPLCAISAVGLGEKFFENKEFHAVSSYEYEVMTADPLKCRMLDFLSHTKLLVNLSNVEHFDLKYLQVHVTKLIDGLYRLTCVQ